jgi:hypothetical protein
LFSFSIDLKTDMGKLRKKEILLNQLDEMAHVEMMNHRMQLRKPIARSVNQTCEPKAIGSLHIEIVEQSN